MPSQTRSLQATQTRTKLLVAAKQAFEESGYLPTRVADIVKRAGLAHGSFYHYFDSKEDIFRELAAVADAQLNAPMQQIILDPNSDMSPTERIRKSTYRYLDAYRREARLLGVIEEVSRYDEYLREARDKRVRHHLEELTESIRKLQGRGLADPTLDPRLVSAVLGSITARFPEVWLVQNLVECSLDEAVEYITKVFVNTLRLEP
ncbi:TetR/AcrR family transcriptional regulator [Frankia sp. AgB32]|nr:TetR/AcrR family transcriptional regulator [Frankia sp. AgB32]